MKTYYGFAIDEVKLYREGVTNGSIPRLPDRAQLQTQDERSQYKDIVFIAILNACERLLVHPQANEIKGLRFESIQLEGSDRAVFMWVLPKKYRPDRITKKRALRLEAFKQAMDIPDDESPSWFSKRSAEAKILHPKSASMHVSLAIEDATKEGTTSE
ncbi:hypothetical protein FA95DRAFT_1557196 [Auriscalpium vulgare]|uniref:Uncharacterized protein n=1 Tax=Auriscalpium vulgare TaxID=40419 RepID=A0ACB8RZV0_9AGAM|nr:hypothetical protein FA95DRAFT_1557196 [Auriscalpium vulgare]